MPEDARFGWEFPEPKRISAATRHEAIFYVYRASYGGNVRLSPFLKSRLSVFGLPKRMN